MATGSRSEPNFQKYVPKTLDQNHDTEEWSRFLMTPPIQRALDMLHFLENIGCDIGVAPTIIAHVIKILTDKNVYMGMPQLPANASEHSKDMYRFYVAPAAGNQTALERSEAIPLYRRASDAHVTDTQAIDNGMANKFQHKRLSVPAPIRRYDFIDEKNEPLFQNSTESVEIAICPELQQQWNQLTAWTFNIIEVERLLSKDSVLHTVGMKVFQAFRVHEVLKIPTDQAQCIMSAWLRKIERHYFNNNPYHTSTHAADVLQAMAYFIKQPEISSLLTEMEGVAALIAAVIHDVEHPGRSSNFLINRGHELAELYNGISVLENHHASLGWRLTVECKDTNILGFLSSMEVKQMRKLLVNMIMATDMSQHVTNVQLFNQVLPKLQKQETSATDQDLDPVDILLRILIKAADISNPTRPWKQTVVWADRICSEYAEQTEQEQELRLPLTLKQFQRNSCNQAETQLSFIKMFVLKLFENLLKLCPAMTNADGPYTKLRSNLSRWEKARGSCCNRQVKEAVHRCEVLCSQCKYSVVTDAPTKADKTE